jgi:ethanolamine-phosphate phospho-lyase
MSYLRTHCGVLVSTDGPGRNVLKMKPPICFSEDDAHTLYEAIDEALAVL